MMTASFRGFARALCSGRKASANCSSRRSRPLRHQPHKGGRSCADTNCDKHHQTYRHQLGGHFLVVEGGSQIGASLNPVRIEIADQEAVPASGTRNLRESCLVHQIGQGQLLGEVNLEGV